MSMWTPAITKPCNEAELDCIVDDALKVLESIGVECQHKKTVDIMMEQFKGISCRNDRLYFSPSFVREHLAEKKTSSSGVPDQEIKPDQEVSFGLNRNGMCWMGLNYCDPVTQEIRPATSEEAALMARFWDAWDVNWCIPLTPGDVPPGMITLAGERIAVKNSRMLGGFLTVLDPEEVRYLRDMFAVVGRKYRLNEQVGLSPLKFNDEGLETALEFMDDPDVEVILSGSIPMAGATCPLDPRSAVVQELAESISQDLLAKAFNVPGGGLMRIETFDFQYLGVTWGTPEWCLYYSLIKQAAAHITGKPNRFGSFRSIAKRPDTHSMHERTASGLWQALHGARQFGGVGQLCIDEVFSPQQAILDREILRYIEKVMKGIDFGRSADDPLALIREGIQQGSFMAVKDTLEGYREFYMPDLFRYWNLGRWQQEGSPSILDEAWETAQKEIAKSDFHLSEDQEKEVDKIYMKAEKYTLSGN